jgi:hypothetical protein
LFRLYADDEPVDEGDVRSTRRFLDMRGVLAAADFDAFLLMAVVRRVQPDHTACSGPGFRRQYDAGRRDTRY